MENDNFIIRLATDADFEMIYTIWKDGIENSFEVDNLDMREIKDKFSNNFFNREGIFNFWVAEDFNKVILGWQSLTKFSSNPLRMNTFSESSTYISINNRFKNVGKLLLEFVMNEAEESSLEYVVGFVSLNNQAAQKITKETGWIEVGTMPKSKKGNNKFVKSFLVRPV